MVTQVMDTLLTLPIMGVGDMVDTMIPGVLTVIMEEAPTGRDTTMVTIMAIMATTTHMQLLTDTVIWIAGTLTDMAHPLTPPTRDPRGLTITIPGTEAELLTPRVQLLPPREMLQVV